MGRLIDADKLIYTLGVSDEDIYFKEMLEEAPTIDAVEVVRCKDCKFWNPWHCSQFNDHTHEVDYCSYGERKESE